jgi:hypothetical protein
VIRHSRTVPAFSSWLGVPTVVEGKRQKEWFHLLLVPLSPSCHHWWKWLQSQTVSFAFSLVHPLPQSNQSLLLLVKRSWDDFSFSASFRLRRLLPKHDPSARPTALDFVSLAKDAVVGVAFLRNAVF